MGFFDWLGSVFKKPAAAPSAPSEKGKNLAFYPPAQRVGKMKSAGKYANGHPVGLVVHFTEGRQSQSIVDGIAQGESDGYAYMFLDQYGRFGQSLPFTDWGLHAGVSSFAGLGTSISSKCVGVEVACLGKLKHTNYWRAIDYDIRVPDDQVFVGPASENIKEGAYQKFTQAQFKALVDLCFWLKDNNKVFSFDYVVGHDEIAPSRKVDPGWSLGMTMSNFRTYLKTNYAKRA